MDLMDYDNACAVVDCQPEALTSQAKEARQLALARQGEASCGPSRKSNGLVEVCL